MIASRLSCACLPFASASATLTRPFLKYMRSGTSVMPRSIVLPISLRISWRVQQQLARPHRRVVGVAAMAVGLDVHVVDEDFAVLHLRVAVAQVHAPFADRLHFGAEQRDAGLERLEDVVVVERLPVLGDVLLGASRSVFSAMCTRNLTRAAARASLAASSTACTMLSGSAMSLPAMSNAVP